MRLNVVAVHIITLCTGSRIIINIIRCSKCNGMIAHIYNNVNDIHNNHIIVVYNSCVGSHRIDMRISWSSSNLNHGTSMFYTFTCSAIAADTIGICPCAGRRIVIYNNSY